MCEPPSHKSHPHQDWRLYTPFVAEPCEPTATWSDVQTNVQVPARHKLSHFPTWAQALAARHPFLSCTKCKCQPPQVTATATVTPRRGGYNPNQQKPKQQLLHTQPQQGTEHAESPATSPYQSFQTPNAPPSPAMTLRERLMCSSLQGVPCALATVCQYNTTFAALKIGPHCPLIHNTHTYIHSMGFKPCATALLPGAACCLLLSAIAVCHLRCQCLGRHRCCLHGCWACCSAAWNLQWRHVGACCSHRHPAGYCLRHAGCAVANQHCCWPALACMRSCCAWRGWLRQVREPGC